MHISRVIALIAVVFATGLVGESVANAEGYSVAAANSSAAKKKMKAAIKKYGLSRIPSASKMVAKKKKATAKASIYDVGAASAPPPTLVEISQSSIKDIFWAPGVVDDILGGNPSQNSCSQLHSGNNEGDSGGFGACHMAESVGYSFSSVLESQSSLCYMQHFPTQANVNAGGVSVVGGELPSGGITKLFSPPTGSSPRLVKVNVSGDPGAQAEGGGGGGGGGGSQIVFIKIYSQSQNQASSNMYHASLYFCGDSGPTGFDEVEISNSGRFHGQNSGADNFGIHSLDVTGFFTMNGNNLIWDTSKARSSTLQSSSDEGYFLSNISVLPSNIIKVKSKDSYGGGSRKGFTQTSFTGNDVTSVRFVKGAFKEQFELAPDRGFYGATKYSGAYYEADPNNSFLDDVQAVDFDSDPFYSGAAPSSPDLSEYDCGATPDVEISMDMGNPTVMNSVRDCQNEEMRNMHFCHDDSEVSMADQNFGSVCQPH